MYGNGRKTIGVFVCEVNFHYQQTLCHSISKRAEEKGYNVAFFSSYPNHSRVRDHDVGENNIAKLPKYEDFDGVIVTPDTYMQSGSMFSIIKRNIMERCRCPIVSIRSKVEEFHNVLVNDKIAMENMILHFIRDHGFTKLRFLSGPKSHPDGLSRYQTFLRVMEENNLPVSEDDVYFGDFWRYGGAKALNQFLAPDKEWPEAIICANDYMALSICQELAKRGHLIPDEICVSGFDNIRESELSIPSLTTVGVPVEQMANQAIDVIEKVWDEKDVEKDVYVDTQILCRESCGCIPIERKSLTLNQASLLRENDYILQGQRANRYLSISMEAAKSVRDVAHKLDGSLYINTNFKNFFLCLCMDVRSKKETFLPLKEGYSKRMWGSLVLMNQARTEDSVFDTANLIPPEYVDESPQIYYFSPLHYYKSSFGYAASNYHDHGTCSFAYQTMLSLVSNALESIRVKEEMSRLLKELEELYIHDYLTGLYNRRGFERLANQYFNKSIESKDSLMVLMIDMDGLKNVNDLHGHLQGDLALQTIANALRHACVGNEICARIGGDEFSVVGINYTQEMKKRFIDRFCRYLDNYNSKSGKKYIVSASYGGCITSYSDNKGFEEYLNLSDSKMYEQKTSKKPYFTITNHNFSNTNDNYY